MKNNSPQFSQLVSWTKGKNTHALKGLFPLINLNTWLRKKYRSKSGSLIDIAKIRSEISSEIINPLFKKPGINIKDLRCLFETALKDLKNPIKNEGEFNDILNGFYLDFKNIAPGTTFPLYWMLSPGRLSQEEELYCKDKGDEMHREWKRLENEMNKIKEELRRLYTTSLEQDFITKDSEIRKMWEELAWIERTERKYYAIEEKINIAIITTHIPHLEDVYFPN